MNNRTGKINYQEFFKDLLDQDEPEESKKVSATKEDKQEIAPSKPQEMTKEQKMEYAKRVWGLGETPGGKTLDMLIGLTRGLERGGQLLGEGMEKIGIIPHIKAIEKYMPNVAKGAYRGATEDVTPQPESIPQAARQGGASYIPYTTGASAVAGMAPLMTIPAYGGGLALHGAAMTQPGEENLLNKFPLTSPFMPKGRLGGAIEDVGLAVLAETGIKGLKSIPAAVRAMKTARTGEEYVGTLAGRQPTPPRGFELEPPPKEPMPTAEENVETLGKRVNFAYESNKKEALADKAQAMKESGNTDIIKAQMAEGNVPKVAGFFENDPTKITSSKLTALKRAISNYRKSGDINEFIEQGEDIFNHSGLSNKASQAVEDLMFEPKDELKLSDDTTKYLGKNSATVKNYDKFFKKGTLKNMDELQQELGSEIGELKRKRTVQGKLDSNEKAVLAELSSKRNALKDMAYKHLQRLSPEARKGYESYFKKWRENVEPYHGSKVIKAMAEGKSQGLSPTKIKGEISFPDPEIEKVLGDIGTEGKKNIMYMHTQGVANDPEKLVHAIRKLKQEKGGSKLVTKDMEQFADDLEKDLKNKEKLKRIGYTATGAAGGAAIGHPVLGAVGGYLGSRNDLISTVLKKLLHK